LSPEVSVHLQLAAKAIPTSTEEPGWKACPNESGYLHTHAKHVHQGRVTRWCTYLHSKNDDDGDDDGDYDGTDWKAMEWTILVYAYILYPCYFILSSGIFPHFGMLYQENSGNPDVQLKSTMKASS
jgi:hypothetical protein